MNLPKHAQKRLQLVYINILSTLEIIFPDFNI